MADALLLSSAVFIQPELISELSGKINRGLRVFVN